MFLTHFGHGTALLEASRRMAREAAQSKPAPDGEWHLANDTGRSVCFQLAGPVAAVITTHGRIPPTREILSRNEAREVYRKLLQAGYTRF